MEFWVAAIEVYVDGFGRCYDVGFHAFASWSVLGYGA